MRLSADPWWKTAGAIALFAAATVAATWPAAVHLNRDAVWHQDVLFSIWRLSWIHHALAAGVPLFDANIFYPHVRTLAYSDATLLEGGVASVLMSAGAGQTAAYNIVYMAGWFGSAVAAFVLAKQLTGRTAAGIVAGLAFGFQPYRFEHAMHLELQWAMWIPLAIWAAHRAVASRRITSGVACGLFVALQILSCIYYGVFLVLFLAVFVPALLYAVRAPTRAVVPFAAGAIAAVLVALPYVSPYRENARELGGRQRHEMDTFSAEPSDYLATTSDNVVYGRAALLVGAPERRLFPGLTILILAVIGASRRRRIGAVYVVGAAIGFVLSLGVHTPVYEWLADAVPLLGGLRALARASILVSVCLAVLAAFGVDALAERARTRAHRAAVVMLPLLVAVEYATYPAQTIRIPQRAAGVYARLAQLPPGPVLELPTATPRALPGDAPEYQFQSTWHWLPLVNGYSGYYPREYLDTLEILRTFPRGGWLDRARSLGVRYLVLHRERMHAAAYEDALAQATGSAGGRLIDIFASADGLAALIELPDAAQRSAASLHN